MRRLLYTSAAILVVGAALLAAPTGPEARHRRARDAVVVFLLVASLGKTLYDSLYYERFRP